MKDSINKVKEVLNMRICIFYALLLMSCSSTKNQIKNQTKDYTYVYEDIGFVYLKIETNGYIKGYLEYGRSIDNNFCNAFFLSKNHKNVCYADSSNYINESIIENWGKLIFSDSNLILIGGGNTISRRFLDFSYPLEFKLIEKTQDLFLIIVKDNPIIYNSSFEEKKNIELNVGNIIRVKNKNNHFYEFFENDSIYQIHENFVKIW